MVRLGIVGVGRWGRRYVDTIARMPDVATLSAFARRSVTSDVQIPGAVQRPHWRDLLGDRLCDGLIVATAPDSHVEIAAAAVAAGIPVLLEKPVALSAGEIAPLLAAVRARGTTPVIVDHVHLYAPWFRRLKEIVHEGKLPVTEVRGIGCGVAPDRDYSALFDYGPHDLAMYFDLVGTDTTPQLVGARRQPTATGQHFEFELEADGVRAHFLVGSGGTSKDRSLTVRAGGHTLVYDDTRQAAHKLYLDSAPVPVTPRAPLEVVVEEFAETVRATQAGRQSPAYCRHDLELAVRIAGVLDAVATAVGVTAAR